MQLALIAWLVARWPADFRVIHGAHALWSGVHYHTKLGILPPVCGGIAEWV